MNNAPCPTILASAAERRPRLILTVGLPRSGKSSFARAAAAHLGAVIVNPDSFRLELHGAAFDAVEEGLVWWATRKCAGALFRAGHHTVIVDATNTTMARRAMWRDPRWDLACVQISSPASVCLERAGDNPGLREAILRMDAAYEPPTVEELEVLTWDDCLPPVPEVP